jgi:NAD+--asparagine ADP-ribosyltransferase
VNKFFIYSLAKNKKVKIIYFPFLFLIFFSLIIIIGFDFYINNFLIKDIKERFQNREIFVQIDSKKIKNIEESFSKIKNIKAYNYFVDSLNMYVEELGFVSCNSSINNHYPSVSLGRMVDNNKQEIVLPKYINNSNHYHFNTIDYLNKYINFQYNSEENKIVNASYKVVMSILIILILVIHISIY